MFSANWIDFDFIIYKTKLVYIVFVLDTLKSNRV